MPEIRSSTSADVVIVGGGVAALEALMALRDLAGDRVRITLVAQDADFVYRPMSVAEPFGFGEPRRFPLQQIASDFDARLVRAKVIAVMGGEQRVVRSSGDKLSYDTLILAPGARSLPPFEHAITFGAAGSGTAMRNMLADLERGTVRRVAFVAPTRAGWALPLYELALMTAERARGRGIDSELSLITPEGQPLEAFGAEPSAVVGDLLAAAGVEFIGSSYAEEQPGGVQLGPGGRTLAVDRVVTLPLVRGPELEGVPAEPVFGFIPVDPHGRVNGLKDVYCAGDATDFPLKQGGLATQQADAVAHHVAARYGAPVEAVPHTPVLRGMLFTGGAQQFLRSDVSGAQHAGAASSQALWWPPTKIAGRYLAPYLLEPGEMDAIGRPPAGFTDLEVPLTEVDPAPADERHTASPAG
jgi:sulfide:quinone oxidoreductase